MGSGNLLRLTETEWEIIFKALDLSRTVFNTNPVLIDTMEDDERHDYIEFISGVMDVIGKDGKLANQHGIAPNALYNENRPVTNG